MSLFPTRRPATALVICSLTLSALPLASAIAQSSNRTPPPRAYDAARNSPSNTSSNTTQQTTPQASQAQRETSEDKTASPPSPPASQSIVGEREAESKRRAAAALADETRQPTLEEAPAPSTDIAAMAEEAEQAAQKTSPRTITKLNSAVCLAGCN